MTLQQSHETYYEAVQAVIVAEHALNSAQDAIRKARTQERLAKNDFEAAREEALEARVQP